MSNDRFAVFILTNRRANNVITYKTLRRQGYTGQIYLLVDDEDSQIKEYKSRYKEEVIVFSKQKAIDITDSGDCFDKRNVIVYARNYSFEVAKQLGIQYFLQLDDDYSAFNYTLDSDLQYITKQFQIKNLNQLFNKTLKFFKNTKAITTVAFAQGGDYMGGENSTLAKLGSKGLFARKVMNTFFCDVSRPFKFFGTLNEDVNMYVSQGLKGKVFITIPMVRIVQKETQTNKGGLTDIYLNLGTYVKSFYSVMYAPACVKISEFGVINKRLHHKVIWKKTAPCIISDSVCSN